MARPPTFAPQPFEELPIKGMREPLDLRDLKAKVEGMAKARAEQGTRLRPKTRTVAGLKPTAAGQGRQAGAVRQANRLMAWSTSGRLIFAPFGQHIAPDRDAIVIRSLRK